jgi:hemerythrin
MGVLCMGFVAWDENYSVHVKEMDDQHKRLFAILDQLHAAMLSGKGNAAMADVLTSLQNYTIQHFAKEEEYMQKFSYPGLAEQKTQHALFIKKIAEYQKGLHDKKLGLSVDVMKFLKEWLVNHIQVIDAKYSDTFHKHNLP